MNLTADLLPQPWYWVALAAAVALLAPAALTAPWRRLTDPSVSHAWLGTIVFLLLLWTLRTGIYPGLGLHLLGATACTLMFGPQLALIALAVVAGGATLSGSIEAWSLPINVLLMGALPVGVTLVCSAAARRWLPDHFFVYIFANAFFGAAISMFVTGLAATALLSATGAYPLEFLRSDYLPWFLFLSWAEAFSTGAALTLLVVYRPQWVASFDDARYLLGK